MKKAHENAHVSDQNEEHWTCTGSESDVGLKTEKGLHKCGFNERRLSTVLKSKPTNHTHTGPKAFVNFGPQYRVREQNPRPASHNTVGSEKSEGLSHVSDVGAPTYVASGHRSLQPLCPTMLVAFSLAWRPNRVWSSSKPQVQISDLSCANPWTSHATALPLSHKTIMLSWASWGFSLRPKE